MITAEEFQKKYHKYIASTKEEAEKEIAKIEIVEGYDIKAVELAGRWCLMIDTAASALQEMGI